jgi:general stress protein 26
MMKDITPPSNEKDFAEWIADFISTVDYSELITVDKGTPHIRPMIYVSDGLNIYMVTANNSAKLQQIKNNPKVSIIIIKSLSEVSETKEVIISGKAEEVQSQQQREYIFKLFLTKPKTYQEWLGKESEYTVLKITTTELKYFDYSTGDSKPKILTF